MSKRKANRQGFTLLELVVVLVVLAALAGILVPVLQNMVTKSHGAAGASNVGEIAKAIQLYEAQTGLQPDFYDALCAGASSLSVPDATTPTLTVVTSTAPISTALNAVGINGTWLHAATPTNATFDPYAAVYSSTPDNVIAGAAGNVVTLTAAGITSLNLPPLAPAGGRSDPQAYVVFGVGARNKAVGRTMIDAPVHFPEAGENPADVYSRFGVVYAIPNSGPARLAKIVAFHDGGVTSLSEHLDEYYAAQGN